MYPGPDELIRKVNNRIVAKSFIRPITRIIQLPVLSDCGVFTPPRDNMLVPLLHQINFCRETTLLKTLAVPVNK